MPLGPPGSGRRGLLGAARRTWRRNRATRIACLSPTTTEPANQAATAHPAVARRTASRPGPCPWGPPGRGGGACSGPPGGPGGGTGRPGSPALARPPPSPRTRPRRPTPPSPAEPRHGPDHALGAPRVGEAGPARGRPADLAAEPGDPDRLP